MAAIKLLVLKYFMPGFLLLIVVKAMPQTCTGSLGDPIVNETYGAGQNYGPRLPSGTTSSLNYQAVNCPKDGNYSITNFSSGCWPLPDVAWHSITDHTGDTNGYFMLINASYRPSDFYIKHVSGLCEGTIFQFSAWLMNMCSNRGTQPNITFTIEKPDGTILVAYQTGNLLSLPNPLWIKYAFNFTTPTGVSDVVLRMRNNAPGGIGNDVALDDISFRPVGPTIQTGITTLDVSSVVVCESDLAKVKLFSIVENCYISTAYQWQVSKNNGLTWADIPGATDRSYTSPETKAGTYLYRLAVAPTGNINSSTCRVLSSVLRVSVISKSTTSIKQSICEGQTYLGYSKGGLYTDTFTAANGCDSVRTLLLEVKTIKSSIIQKSICKGQAYLGYSRSGNYIDSFTSANGCDSVRTLQLTVLDKPVADLGKDFDICSGDTVALFPGQYNSYLWQDGSTNKNFIVKKGGRYAITVTNACGVAKDEITIHEKLCNLYFPTAFTPNNDGNNDLFRILNANNLQLYYFAVYNRWGQRVFETSDYTKGWDGTYDGKLQGHGVYIWTCRYKRNNIISTIKGTVTLVK